MYGFGVASIRWDSTAMLLQGIIKKTIFIEIIKGIGKSDRPFHSGNTVINKGHLPAVVKGRDGQRSRPQAKYFVCTL
jgi:hypothetical protein